MKKTDNTLAEKLVIFVGAIIIGFAIGALCSASELIY